MLQFVNAPINSFICLLFMSSAFWGRIYRHHALGNQLLKSGRKCSRWSRWSSSVRPPTAPKQYPDVKSIAQAPELYSDNAKLRNYQSHAFSPFKIEQLSHKVSVLNKGSLQPRTALKALEREYAAARSVAASNPSASDQSSRLYDEIQRLRRIVDDADAEERGMRQKNVDMALGLPNLTHSSTPTDGQPKILRYLNHDPDVPKNLSNERDHADIGRKLNLIDFEAASTTTGWGFYYLLNEAVLLEQALVQYATSCAMVKGWMPVSPPSLVYSHIADSCGFQPRDANDEQQIWQIAQPERDATKPSRSLAATAEIPLAAMKANQYIPEMLLPVKHIATSRCYRAEAGARGVDTKGLYRVHEFTKVEMFAWANAPTKHSSEEELLQYSNGVFDEMVGLQCEILSSLDLPCRVLEMPSNDLGASAYRKIDIEAFFPSRTKRDEGWGEVTSASMCTDYQSRRLNTRIQMKGRIASTRFPHTLNGTAMAIPRVIACILENGWQEEDQSVTIPAVLRPYMGGIEKISRGADRV